MKRLMSLLSASLIFLLCLSLPARAMDLPMQPAVPSLTEHLILLFGAGEAEVLGALNEPIISETQEAGAQKTLRVNCAAGENPASVALTFYNDVLMACEYSFTDSEAAYLFTKQLREELESVLGEKSTYPGIVADGRGYLDDLTDISQMQSIHVYYEDWTPELDEAVVHQLIGDIEYSRTDLRLELSVYSAELASVSMKYTFVRNGLK